MRLDKYLKVTRLVKRRTLAQELCNGGHVSKNGRTAKPSSRVEVGDVLDIRFGPRTLAVEVVALASSADKKTAGLLYRRLSEKDLAEAE
ncbi:MAG TPA: RNA-binding S4 domain-containing protein [Firmicutes bacterium]|nr:RNA-binding S4 domain-containing protein [Candidatus Fermentithermobacillaceae bacterium]